MNISPINSIDYARFIKLSEEIAKHKDLRSFSSPGSKPEIKIYTSCIAHEKKTYVSLEIKGFVPEEIVDDIYNNLDLNILKI